MKSIYIYHDEFDREMEIHYNFFKGESQTRFPDGSGTPPMPPTVDILKVMLYGVDIIDSLEPRDIERMEEEILDDLTSE
jgi:hypothetical protein